eukprot:9679452-Alexandrium_andersonii.AAC.1
MATEPLACFWPGRWSRAAACARGSGQVPSASASAHGLDRDAPGPAAAGAVLLWACSLQGGGAGSSYFSVRAMDRSSPPRARSSTASTSFNKASPR